MIQVAETTHVLGPTAWLKVGCHGARRCWGWRHRCRGGRGGRRWGGGDGFDAICLPEDQISAIGIEFRVQCEELGLSQIKFCFHRTTTVTVYNGVPLVAALHWNPSTK